MTTNATAKTTTLHMQQMLFGYDRGHSLLASSRGVTKPFSSKILPDTDWDPRVPTKTEGYLSARPVKDEKSYVVMKTWRAPEMPRPGCVWTQVLIIAEADLSRIPDLTVLAHHFKRPQDTDDFSSYNREIAIETPTRAASLNDVEERIVQSLVKLVYTGQYDHTATEKAESVESAFLAIWSQQWPALRRRFSFRTAPLPRNKQTRRSDYEVELISSEPTSNLKPHDRKRDVLGLVTRDIVKGGSTAFRRFLWRYGADTNGARENLLFLAHIYQELKMAQDGQTDVPELIAEIGELFPKLSSAHLLKKDLTQPADADFSLLPALDQFDVVLGVQSAGLSSTFPKLGPVHRKSVNRWMDSRPTEFADLLIALGDDPSAFADSVYKGVSSSKDRDFIWQLLEKSEMAFIRALGSSVIHLADDRISQLTDERLLEILEAVAPSNAKSLARLVPRLLLRENTALISTVNSAAPEAVTAAVVSRVAEEIEKDQSGNSVHMNWVECVKDIPAQIINFAENSIESRRQLLVCRYLLNADTRKLPISVWTSRLDRIKNDLRGSLDLEFRVFLLIQALSAPDETAPVIFQDTFDQVYDALASDKLRFRTEMQLAEHLPHIGWFNNWDKCLRLKIAIVSCYKHLSLSKKQLRKVTSNVHVQHELEKLWSQS